MSNSAQLAELVSQHELAEFCSGFGQHHSERAEVNPRPYNRVTWHEITEMMTTPPSVAKGKAQWVIFSDIASREVKEQREKGAFYCLWADLDEAPTTLEHAVHSLAESIGADVYGYTSRSATEVKQKGRLLVPLDKPVSGEQFELLQECLNDRLAVLELAPDRATESANQLCYLPNRGEFYATVAVDYHGSLDVGKTFIGELEAREAAEREQAEINRQLAEQAAAKRQARLDRMQTQDQVSPVDAYNDAHPLDSELERHGFRRKGRRYLSPYSGSGGAAVILHPDGKLWCSHHQSDIDAGVGQRSGRVAWGDAFDLFCHFGHGGDYSAAVKAAGDMLTVNGVSITLHNQQAYKQARRASDEVPSHSGGGEEVTVAVSGDAQRMAKEIREVIAEALQLSDDDAGKLTVDPRPLDAMMNGAFWFPAGSKIWHITQRGNLVEHSEADAWGQLEATFGKAVDDATITELVELVDTGHKSGTLEEKKARRGLAKECRSVTRSKMLFYLKRHNQRRRVSRHIDMFSSEAVMLLKPEMVVISQPHTAFPTAGYDVRVIEDYKQHFARFDEFLKFLAAARFAPDRKKAYLWMRLLSDWGKDLLLDGVLGRDGLGIVAGVSESEVEKMFEGGPVGRDPVEFLHAWVVLINEFKKVNGEMKQLERSIRLAPKHQLSAEVPVYAKVFTSAEGVASLAGDNGVEDQFANRFSAFEEGDNKITERELYVSDSDHYIESLRAYAAEVLNSEVERYRAMGEKVSRNTAKGHIDDFHRRWGIAEIHGRLDDRIPEIAADIRAWLLSEEQMFNRDLLVEGARRVLVRPATHIDRWIGEHIARSEQRTISLKREAIYKAMSVDGKGQWRPYINGRQARGILLSE